VRTDAEGRAVWQRTFGGPLDDGAYGVAVDGARAVVVGYTRTDGAGGYDVWAARLDLADGEAVWTRTLNRSAMDAATSVALAPDGGVLVAASTAGGGFGRDDIWLIRLTGAGETEWTRTLGGDGADTPWSLAALADGGLVVAASTQSRGAGSADAWLLNLDRDGAVRWQRTYGGELWDWPGQVAVGPDGSLLMAGYTTSLGAGYEDVWVLRLDAEGRL
jgi:glucose/arabinose dehydrogenase